MDTKGIYNGISILLEKVSITIDHENYRHSAMLNKDNVNELIEDFVHKA